MHFEIVDPSSVDPELLCPLCQNVWENPVELRPCQDIFCKACLKIERIRQAELNGDSGGRGGSGRPPAFHCPKCEQNVEESRQPNRVLVNVSLEVEVRCSECGWVGTRENAGRHACQAGDGSGQRQDTATATTSTASSPTFDSPVPIHSSLLLQQGTPHPPPPGTSSSNGAVPFPRSSLTNTAQQQQQSHRGSNGAPLRPLRRAQDDNTESALLRNFEEIDDEGNEGSGGGSGGGNDGAFYPLPPIRNAPNTSGGGATGLNHTWSGFGDFNVNNNNNSNNNSNAVMHHSSSGGGLGSLGNTQNSVSLPSISGGPQRQQPPGWSGGSSGADYGVHASGDGHHASSEPWRALGLPQSEYEQLMGAFMIFDEEDSKRLNQDQFQALARYLNYVNSSSDGLRLFQDVDTTHRGFVTFEDFCRWRRNNQPHPDALYGMSTAQYTDAILKFRSADPYITGVIAADAFRKMCLDNDMATTEQQAQQMLDYCDDRQSGYVSLHQFLKLTQLLLSGGMVPIHSPRTPAPAGSYYGDVGSGNHGNMRTAGGDARQTSGLNTSNSSGSPHSPGTSAGHSVVGGRTTGQNLPHDAVRFSGAGAGAVPSRQQQQQRRLPHLDGGSGSGGGGSHPVSPRPPAGVKGKAAVVHPPAPTGAGAGKGRPQVVRMNAGQGGSGNESECAVM